MSEHSPETTAPSRAPEPDSPVAATPGFIHRYADVDGTRVHYVTGGAGPMVVLLHGWPYTWLVWRRVLPLLAATGHTVVAPDLRGFGDTAKPEDSYTKAEVADDVRQLVRQLGVDQIDLVGMDIGAMVAYAWAAAHPEGLRTLVLSESLLPGFGLEELMNPAYGGFWHFGFHMQVDLAEMLTAGREREYLDPMWEMGARFGGLGPDDRAELLRTFRAPGGMRGGFQHYRTLIEDGKANRAGLGRKLDMPVLVLNGDHGIPQGPLLDGVRRVAEDVRSDIVPDAGHAYAADNPTWVADRLTRFIGTDDRTALLGDLRTR